MYPFFFIPIVSCSDYYLVSYISFCLKTLCYHQLVNKDSKNKKKNLLKRAFSRKSRSSTRGSRVYPHTPTHTHTGGLTYSFTLRCYSVLPPKPCFRLRAISDVRLLGGFAAIPRGHCAVGSQTRSVELLIAGGDLLPRKMCCRSRGRSIGSR